MTLAFHPLTLFDRETMQAVTLPSGRRDCNYTFANLVGWQFWYYTEVCVLENAVGLHRLKTHQYWQRWGAKEFYRDADCVCYKLDI